ncbi:MAG TPA: MBL fold metallo-hydrolase [Solirubrobacteraceae bacterium]|jgi:L-ascorbate metabolism protein UlaG (beta-lactamase superfamily)
MPDGASASRAVAAPDRIVFLGHSTVLIELDGVRLLTDPLLRARVAHLRRLPAPPDPHHYAAPDAILISHLHQDHLDLPSLRLIGSSTPLVVSAGAGAWLRRSGFSDVRELGVGEQLRLGALTVTAVPAHHDGRRRPRGPRANALGFIVHGSRSIYFAGDTELFAGMAELAPSLDVALLPVAGWGPTLGAGHMDPLHAARAARLIEPRLAIPIHWGTLQPIGPFWGMTPARIAAPPRRFAEHLASLAPGVEVRVLAPGQETVL